MSNKKHPSSAARTARKRRAATVIHAIGKVNFLFDPMQTPHLTANDLSQRAGVRMSSLSAKSKRICDLLRIGPFEPAYCRRALLADNPLVWLIEVNGFLVDARTMSPEIQDELRRRGLIPDLTEGDERDEA